MWIKASAAFALRAFHRNGPDASGIAQKIVMTMALTSAKSCRYASCTFVRNDLPR